MSFQVRAKSGGQLLECKAATLSPTLSHKKNGRGGKFRIESRGRRIRRETGRKISKDIEADITPQ